MTRPTPSSAGRSAKLPSSWRTRQHAGDRPRARQAVRPGQWIPRHSGTGRASAAASVPRPRISYRGLQARQPARDTARQGRTGSMAAAEEEGPVALGVGKVAQPGPAWALATEPPEYAPVRAPPAWWVPRRAMIHPRQTDHPPPLFRVGDHRERGSQYDVPRRVKRVSGAGRVCGLPARLSAAEQFRRTHPWPIWRVVCRGSDCGSSQLLPAPGRSRRSAPERLWRHPRSPFQVGDHRERGSAYDFPRRVKRVRGAGPVCGLPARLSAAEQFRRTHPWLMWRVVCRGSDCGSSQRLPVWGPAPGPSRRPAPERL